jgi:transketolase
MNIALAKERIKEPVMMRETYCKTLMYIAAEDKRIVALDADLMKAIGMIPFMEKYPERTFNCGVQEANMMGVAAGLSATGKVPFAHTFGPFATRRCFDQIFVSVAYAKMNVRIVGSDPGVTAAYNGGTHMPFEDMGLMQLVPGAYVIEPTDSAMLEDVLRQSAEKYGVFYIRLLRKNAVKIYEDGSRFDIGRGVLLRDGNDVSIIASGILVDEALKAAEQLESEGISARVVNLFTWKPIDDELVIKCARETGAIVTCENHNTVNGLGSAVCDVVCGDCPVPVEKIGVQDEFGEVGPEDYLRKRYRMSAEDIMEKAKKVLTRK